MGLTALFNIARISTLFNKAIEKVDDKTLETLQFMGEQFVNNARIKGNYNDRTGNLRSSIGYIIVDKGNIVQSNFQTSGSGADGKTGMNKAEDFANEVALINPKGIILIGVAGMEYSLYVEKRHHLDVISGSVPDGKFFKSIMNEINL